MAKSTKGFLGLKFLPNYEMFVVFSATKCTQGYIASAGNHFLSENWGSWFLTFLCHMRSASAIGLKTILFLFNSFLLASQNFKIFPFLKYQYLLWSKLWVLLLTSISYCFEVWLLSTDVFFALSCEFLRKMYQTIHLCDLYSSSSSQRVFCLYQYHLGLYLKM